MLFKSEISGDDAFPVARAPKPNGASEARQRAREDERDRSRKNVNELVWVI